MECYYRRLPPTIILMNERYINSSLYWRIPLAYKAFVYIVSENSELIHVGLGTTYTGATFSYILAHLSLSFGTYRRCINKPNNRIHRTFLLGSNARWQRTLSSYYWNLPAKYALCCQRACVRTWLKSTAKKRNTLASYQINSIWRQSTFAIESSFPPLVRPHRSPFDDSSVRPTYVRIGSYQNECLDRNEASATGFWGLRFAESDVAPSVLFIVRAMRLVRSMLLLWSRTQKHIHKHTIRYVDVTSAGWIHTPQPYRNEFSPNFGNTHTHICLPPTVNSN